MDATENQAIYVYRDGTPFDISNPGKTGTLLQKKNVVKLHLEPGAGSAVTQLIDSVNFDDEESMNWFHRTLRRAGIIDALRNVGAQEGSTVRMDVMEFDFVE